MKSRVAGVSDTWLIGAVWVVLAVTISPTVRAQSQLELNQQANGALVREESKLNAAIAAYRNRLQGSQRDSFDESQRLWLAYRKAACEFEASTSAGGSVHEMAYSACLREYASRRMEVIQKLATCTEGDASCPVFTSGA